MSHQIKRFKCYPRGEINWDKGMYISMSMNNTAFQNEDTLTEMLGNISEKCSSCSIIVGDYLHRYNEELINGLNEDQNISTALNKGDILVELFKKVSSNSDIKTHYDFKYTRDFLSHPKFFQKMERFKEVHKKNQHFESLTEHTINIFLRRQKNIIKVSEERARELCRLYLFEELVIFEILAEDGYKVNMYPGNQLPIIKAIVTGQLKDVSVSLESIQAVEIKFRPKQIVHTQ